MQHSGRFTCPAALVDNSIKFDVFKIGIEMLKRIFLVGLASLGVWSSCVVGQSGTTTQWPTQPVRVIVPFPGGASTLDAVVRLLVPEVARDLAGSVFVENKPGAGTVIGVDAVAKAGERHTFGAVANSFAVNQSLVKNLPYNLDTDLVPVVLLARTANVLAVRPELPIRNLPELIAYAKKNPGRLNYASSGNGTIVQLSAELFKAQADVFVVHIPYKGTALAIPDLISGKVDVLFDSLPTGMPHVRDGRLRALGVTTLKRTALAPGIPAIAEVLPGYESNT